MQLGDIVNAGAADAGKPLDGVRILAVEQMQALPFATQLLGRLGAEVVKVESVAGGDQARGALPAVVDPYGRNVGSTFLRNNLGKRSIAVDLKHPRGIEIVLGLAERFDVFAENSKAGTMARLGLGFDEVRCPPIGCRLRLGVGIRQRWRVALRVASRVRTDRRGDVGDLRVQACGR